jgi:hypothetical protein
MLRPQLDGLHRQFNRSVPGHYDDWDGGVQSVQTGQYFQHVAVGQAVVQHGGIRPRGGVDSFGLLAGGASYYLKSTVFEKTLDGGQELGLVVNNQNAAVGHNCF